MTTATTLPVWRSLLFCPANVEKFVTKAHARGADAIILDLEDSVAFASKEEARQAVRTAAKTVGQAGADVLVRINRPLPLAVRDIEAAVSADVFGLVLPKVASADHVRLLSETVLEVELAKGVAPGHSRFLLLVESAAALDNIHAIAASDQRVAGLAVGGEDLATDLGAEPTVDALYVAKMMGLHAARAANILPIGVLASVAALDDDDGYRAMIRRSRALGFEGATCVHPKHVAVLNEEFSPSANEVAKAKALLAADPGNAGAFFYDGAMIDMPAIVRAKRTVSRARAHRSDD
jgi:citrate lyase subunit beta/citryl-CoA lyase